MGGVVDDIVNPIGAITGVDPVKDATGFTGTSFGPTKAQLAAQNAPTTQLVGGSGSGGPPASSGQYLQQFQQQQARPMGQFGQQLNQLSNQIDARTAGIGNIQSPSAQSTAAAVTANSIQAKQQNPVQMQQAAQGPSQFWQSMWA